MFTEIRRRNLTGLLNNKAISARRAEMEAQARRGFGERLEALYKRAGSILDRSPQESVTRMFDQGIGPHHSTPPASFVYGEGEVKLRMVELVQSMDTTPKSYLRYGARIILVSDGLPVTLDTDTTLFSIHSHMVLNREGKQMTGPNFEIVEALVDQIEQKLPLSQGI